MYTFFLPFLLFVMGVAPAGDGGPGSATPDDPVRLVEILGPRTLGAGAVGHFRARVADRSARPVTYLWDLGDGTLSVGALVSYVYATPGTYTVTVVARNAVGRDTLRVPVLVTTPPAQPDTVQQGGEGENEVKASVAKAANERARWFRTTVPRTALYGGRGLASEKGGYTWVVATDLWAERAHARMLRYRLRGFRADVYVDAAGRGSPAHRIVLGQFTTKQEALAARSWLPDDATSAWLLALEGAAEPLSGEQ